ncbi:MAG: phosphodiester glycosidase family protein [Lachnospiraceae bacterium]|nr:phosphodiester glycosidase family protein [Lachnospiraceae bacterium]
MKTKIWKGIGYTSLVLLTFVAALAIILTLIINSFCHGPSPSAKKVFVTTILETGQLKFLASIFLTPEEIQEVVNLNSMEDFNEEVNTSLIIVEAKSNKDSGKVEQNSTSTGVVEKPSDATEEVEEQDIEIVEIAGRTFFATMMIVKDPSRVSLATIYPWRDKGDTLDQLVKDNDAIAGINAGLYESSGNSGGRPSGVVVSEGEILMNKPQSYPGLVLIGLNEDDILVIQDLSKMNATECEAFIKENKIRDACCFQEEKSDKNNHFVQLIINGEQREMNGMGSGLNPRTAIGQRADGALLLLVTDGRGASGHLGASASDLINVMAEYGAVNAANLDGGSSSCMYYEEEYLMNSVTFYYSNSSWRLPFAFIVK